MEKLKEYLIKEEKEIIKRKKIAFKESHTTACDIAYGEMLLLRRLQKFISDMEK